MSVPQSIPIGKIIEILVDQTTSLSPRFLHRLTDLEPTDATQLEEAWPAIAPHRREALLEDLEEIHLADDLLNFEAVARIGIKDKEPGVRSRAISILREYELIDMIPVFINMAEHDPDPDVRANAASALASFIYLGEVEELTPSRLLRVEECLLRLVASEDTKLVHRRAVEALGFSSRKEVNGLIEKAYNSADFEWQTTALYAMGRSANSRWNSRVLKMLDHNQPMIRAEAASAAGELEIGEAKPILLEMLDDSDIDVRMASIWALSQIGGAGVRRALEKRLETTDDEEEADQIGKALENLEFTDEMRSINLMEISGDEDDEADIDADLLEDSDDLISEDGSY